MRSKLTLLLFLCYILSACTTKNIDTSSQLKEGSIFLDKEAHLKELERIVKLVNENSPTICSFKKRVIFDYSDKNMKIKLKGTIEKDCDNNGEIKVMGPFGIVLYEAIYLNGNLELKRKNETIVLAEKARLNFDEMIRYIFLLNYPAIRPSTDYMFSIDGDDIIFKRDNTVIIAKKNQIKQVDFDNTSVRYVLEKTEFKEVVIIQKDKGMYLRIQFE
jgi:hypothetical protein